MKLKSIISGIDGLKARGNLDIDINGVDKPNRIGQDIFFLSVYKNHVTALGKGKNHARLKTDCSPIGRGVYCSEYYLLGGSF